MKNYARPDDQLPKGIRVVSAEVCDTGKSVKIIVSNYSRNTVDLDSSIILAELAASRNDLEALVGPSLENTCTINGKQSKCLLDTGSQVSIMCETFFRNNFCDSELESIEDFKLTGAGGHSIPYLGFVRVNVEIPSDGLV
jgi:hypothetical protein